MSVLRLKEILAEKEASGKDLAEKVGISEMSMSRVVSGKSFPRPEVLLKIAEELKVDIRELFHPTLPASKAAKASKASMEPLYIKKNGRYVKVGEINLKKN